MFPNKILNLLKQNKVVIRKSIFDCYEDRKIYMFQILSDDTDWEICILQQIVFTNGEKINYAYVNGKEQKWSHNIIQQLLDIVLSK